jgi:hypothetical protein
MPNRLSASRVEIEPHVIGEPHRLDRDVDEHGRNYQNLGPQPKAFPGAFVAHAVTSERDLCC